MSNQWFRLYAEFANDPKVQMMPEVMQRRLVMLMCMRCCDVTVTFHVTECDKAVAFALRISDQELAETKELFLRRGFIDEQWNLLNWDKRQFSSDSSSERTRAYRERKRSNIETSQERHSDALEQNRTDTEQRESKSREKRSNKKPETNPQFEEFWKSYPKRRAGSYEKALIAYHHALGKGATDSKILAAAKAYAVSEEATSDGGKFAKGCAAWLNADRWADAAPESKPEPADPNRIIGRDEYERCKRIIGSVLDKGPLQSIIKRYEEQNAIRH